MTKKVLILGASGKIGHHSKQAFAAAGWAVKNFNRQEDDMSFAARDVDLIVNGLNPPNYHNWKELIPKITKNVIFAAKESGASVLLPGNVYHFGDQGGVWSENTPPNPVSRKGEIRLEMEREYKESGIQTIVLRAGNFIDPERNGCIMSLVFLRDLAKKKINLPGSASAKQAMCYLPDWAQASVALAEIRHTLAQFEDVPFPGHTLTANEIKSSLEDILGRELKFKNFPWWVFKLSAPFWELAREMNEMRYLWSTDHELSGRKFQTLLPDFKATNIETVLLAALPPNLKQEVELRKSS